jgi:hypothetical protein
MRVLPCANAFGAANTVSIVSSDHVLGTRFFMAAFAEQPVGHIQRITHQCRHVPLLDCALHSARISRAQQYSHDTLDMDRLELVTANE